MTHSKALVTGPRLFLRHPVSDDADEFVTLRETSHDFHLAWEPIPEDGSDPIGRASFERLLAAFDTPESQKHLMCRITDGAIVEYVGLSQIFMGPFCSAYMGFWVGVQHARRGYATEGIVVSGARVHAARPAPCRGQRHSDEHGIAGDRSQVWFSKGRVFSSLLEGFQSLAGPRAVGDQDRRVGSVT